MVRINTAQTKTIADDRHVYRGIALSSLRLQDELPSLR